MAKEVEFTIKPDGVVEVDQKGYEGKQCVNDVQEILSALGKEKKTVRKKEYYKDQKQGISQHR